MVLISITRLRLRSWRFFPMFAWEALWSSRQVARAEGHLGAKYLTERGKTFWTATMWTSEGPMKKFMIAGAHGAAMRKLIEWCDEAAVVHWTQESADLPSWTEAHRRLQSEGRLSKVSYPSAEHLAREFPAPRVKGTD